MPQVKPRFRAGLVNLKQTGLNTMNKCQNCGRCCRRFSLIIKGLSTDKHYKEYFLTTTDCEIEGDKLIIFRDCKHLFEKEGKYYCKLHDTGEKPFICKIGNGKGGSLGKITWGKVEGCEYGE